MLLPPLCVYLSICMPVCMCAFSYLWLLGVFMLYFPATFQLETTQYVHILQNLFCGSSIATRNKYLFIFVATLAILKIINTKIALVLQGWVTSDSSLNVNDSILQQNS